MYHPGYYIHEEWAGNLSSLGKYYLNTSRENELNTLVNLESKFLINKLNIELISYREL